MKTVLSFFALSLLLPMIAESQSAGLSAGARVRVTSPRDDLRKHVGTVMEVRGDTLVVAGSRGSRGIALDNITALDISTGSRTQVGRSALIGFGAGALLGGVLGVAAYEEPDFFFENAAQMGAASALFFGGIGMVAGAVVGALHRTDRWERRDPPLRAVIGGSLAGGVSLRVSSAF